MLFLLLVSSTLSRPFLKAFTKVCKKVSKPLHHLTKLMKVFRSIFENLFKPLFSRTNHFFHTPHQSSFVATMGEIKLHLITQEWEKKITRTKKCSVWWRTNDNRGQYCGDMGYGQNMCLFDNNRPVIFRKERTSRKDSVKEGLDMTSTISLFFSVCHLRSVTNGLTCRTPFDTLFKCCWRWISQEYRSDKCLNSGSGIVRPIHPLNTNNMARKDRRIYSEG